MRKEKGKGGEERGGQGGKGSGGEGRGIRRKGKEEGEGGGGGGECWMVGDGKEGRGGEGEREKGKRREGRGREGSGDQCNITALGGWWGRSSRLDKLKHPPSHTHPTQHATTSLTNLA